MMPKIRKKLVMKKSKHCDVIIFDFLVLRTNITT